jgi:hypothetical protein
VRAAPRLYTLAFTLQLRNNDGKTSVRVVKKCLGEQRWERFVVFTCPPFYGRPRLVCWPQSPLACASGDLGQPSVSVKYLPSCRTKWFPTPTTFEKKPLVRVQMWSAKNGTSRSSWISLLPATRRHLDCSTRCLLTWVRAADLLIGHP